MAKLFNNFKKNLNGVDLKDDTIKISLTPNRSKIETEKEQVIIDADDLSHTGELKATMAFVTTPRGTECIHFEHTGKQITKVDRIGELASQGRWIWHSKVGRGIPAAKIQKLPFKEVLGYIRMGWLYEYVAKK